jgi:S-adenosylmethionine:tRNA ribosyltransferase-isomerase
MIVEGGADGMRRLRFDPDLDLETLLAQEGEVPLPPYIGASESDHRERYQTIFARVPGSVAAPTASLHFTDAVFAGLAERGVSLARLTLDVGIGTFRPMREGPITEHHMHSERYAISVETSEAIASAKAEGRRVVAAGTTVVRALEGAAQQDGRVHPANRNPGAGETDLFIRPGFRFAVVDALLTNFHLPRSTLLTLVSAFAGYERIRAAYQHAIAAKYRFFSFGDAMFVERMEP